MPTATRRAARVTSRVSLSRMFVLIVALIALGIKLLLAAYTYGTADVTTWTAFAEGVRQRGPVGVYGIDFVRTTGLPYNHPPLIGYYLWFLNHVDSWTGLPLKFSLRAITSIADVITAMLVFEMLRRRVPLLRATLSALVVATSPILILVSGFHGNTDPLFVMLALLGCYLIIDLDRPAAGGAVLALAIGIKIVPIVVLPTLAVYLVRRGWGRLARAAAGFVALFAITWGPAAVSHYDALRQNVLGYGGIPYRPWGFVARANDLGWAGVSHFLGGTTGQHVTVLLCAALPAIATWRKPSTVLTCAAASFVAFLALSPAFGVQYLVWAAAPAVLLNLPVGAVYNLLGGLVLFKIYDHWAGGWPWPTQPHGHQTRRGPVYHGLFDSGEVSLLTTLWVILLGVLALGIQAIRTEARPKASGDNAIATEASDEGAPMTASRQSTYSAP